MSEERIETKFEKDETGNYQPQSMEDKFFGVKTEILKKDKNAKPEEEINLEIIDDVPEEDRRPPKVDSEETEVDDETIDKEISDYSKRASDRINKIKYEYHEERRAKEQAQRESKEAVIRLQALMNENRKLQEMVEKGGQALSQHSISNAQWAKLNAQNEYKKAYEEGDADAMAKAQEALSKAVMAEQSANQYKNQLETQTRQKQLQPTQQYQQNTQNPPELDADLKAWAAKNPWFMSNIPEHQEMTSYALVVDQRLRNAGVDPAKNSQKYYQEVDSAMRKEYPNFFGVFQTEVEKLDNEEKRQPINVVAPATRNSGNSKNPRNIRLTQTQVKIARQLGIKPEQYAKQLLKES